MKGHAEAEAPILWLPDATNRLIGKDPDAGKDWRREEKGIREDEMVGWHHRLNGHERKQALGVGDGKGSLACCSPWGSKELEMTEWLNWTDSIILTCTWGCETKTTIWFWSYHSLLMVNFNSGHKSLQLSLQQVCPSLQPWSHGLSVTGTFFDQEMRVGQYNMLQHQSFQWIFRTDFL